MDACYTRSECSTCPGRVVCHCLHVTEEMLLEALAALNLGSVNEIRAVTGAGDGCTACHKRLHKYIERQRIDLPMIQSASA
jgi:bacterioferritin-associated ferredoxin